MPDSNLVSSHTDIEARILSVRGKKIILDSGLANIYGVKTKVLNQAVKRNSAKFPEDFMFQITPQELSGLTAHLTGSEHEGNRSQTVTGSQKHRDPRYLPYAFTEHGAIMAATVLNSPKAIEMSVFIVRAFIKMREQLLATAKLEQRLAEIERILLIHDSSLLELYQKIRPLLLPPEESKKKPIGFNAVPPEKFSPQKKIKSDSGNPDHQENLN